MHRAIQTAVKFPLSFSIFELLYLANLHRVKRFPTRMGNASADKFRSRSSYIAYVRDCERRHFAKQLLHAQEHYGLRPRSGSLYLSFYLSPFLSHTCISTVSLSCSLGIIQPITLCLNIYRAALGKHEPSLCMGAQHVG